MAHCAGRRSGHGWRGDRAAGRLRVLELPPDIADVGRAPGRARLSRRALRPRRLGRLGGGPVGSGPGRSLAEQRPSRGRCAARLGRHVTGRDRPAGRGHVGSPGRGRGGCRCRGCLGPRGPRAPVHQRAATARAAGARGRGLAGVVRRRRAGRVGVLRGHAGRPGGDRSLDAVDAARAQGARRRSGRQTGQHHPARTAPCARGRAGSPRARGDGAPDRPADRVRDGGRRHRRRDLPLGRARWGGHRRGGPRAGHPDQRDHRLARRGGRRGGPAPRRVGPRRDPDPALRNVPGHGGVAQLGLGTPRRSGPGVGRVRPGTGVVRLHLAPAGFLRLGRESRPRARAGATVRPTRRRGGAGGRRRAEGTGAPAHRVGRALRRGLVGRGGAGGWGAPGGRP